MERMVSLMVFLLLKYVVIIEIFSNLIFFDKFFFD